MLFIRVLLFTIFVPGLVIVGLPYWLLTSGIDQLAYDIGPARVLGFLPAATGALFYVWCAWDFAVTGGGTPAPIDPPRKLVVRGLYRVMRNPMYVGIVLILIGENVLFESGLLLLYAGLVWVAFHLFVTQYEEPTLKQKFGASYDEYCRAVPRWILKLRDKQ